MCHIDVFPVLGNNIPSDILKAIGTALQRNIDYHAIFEEQETMRRSLKQEIDHLHHEKSLQVWLVWFSLSLRRVNPSIFQFTCILMYVKFPFYRLTKGSISVQVTFLDNGHSTWSIIWRFQLRLLRWCSLWEDKSHHQLDCKYSIFAIRRPKVPRRCFQLTLCNESMFLIRLTKNLRYWYPWKSWFIENFAVKGKYRNFKFWITKRVT